MRAPTTRQQHSRTVTRYQTDLTAVRDRTALTAAVRDGAGRGRSRRNFTRRT